MAYKFQSGLARLNGTIALDGANDKLQLSGGIEFADKSIDVADLNLAAGTNYNLGGGADGAEEREGGSQWDKEQRSGTRMPPQVSSSLLCEHCDERRRGERKAEHGSSAHIFNPIAELGAE